MGSSSHRAGPCRRILSSLLSLSVVAAAAATARSEQTWGCLQSRSRELAAVASCGDQGSINYCLGVLLHASLDDPAAPVLGRLEECFVNAGCTVAEAKIEALWTLRRCESPDELRRRAGGGGGGGSGGGDDDEDDGEDGSSSSSNSNGGSKNKNNGDDDSDGETETAKAHPGSPKTKAAEKTTPSPSPSPSPHITSAPSPAPQTVVVTATPTAAAVVAKEVTTSRPDRPSVCYTPTEIDITVCPTQSTGPSSGHALSCYPTQATTSACVEGAICHTDDEGRESCMFAHNRLDAGGIVVAIFLASAAATAAVSMTFLCCRERAQHRRLALAAEAAAIARAAKKNSSGAHKNNVTVTVSPSSSSTIPPRKPTPSSSSSSPTPSPFPMSDAGGVPPLPSLEAGRPLMQQDDLAYGRGVQDPFLDQHHMR